MIQTINHNQRRVWGFANRFCCVYFNFSHNTWSLREHCVLLFTLVWRSLSHAEVADVENNTFSYVGISVASNHNLLQEHFITLLTQWHPIDVACGLYHPNQKDRCTYIFAPFLGFATLCPWILSLNFTTLFSSFLIPLLKPITIPAVKHSLIFGLNLGSILVFIAFFYWAPLH